MKQSEAERLAMEEEEEKGVSEESDEEVPSEEIYEESSPKQENLRREFSETGESNSFLDSVVG